MATQTFALPRGYSNSWLTVALRGIVSNSALRGKLGVDRLLDAAALARVTRFDAPIASRFCYNGRMLALTRRPLQDHGRAARGLAFSPRCGASSCHLRRRMDRLV